MPLYNDSEKRKRELADQAKVLRDKGYIKTAERISGFIPILEGNKIPDSFPDYFLATLDEFKNEFVYRLPEKQNFGRDCIEQIYDIIINKGLVEIGVEDFSTLLTELAPLIENIVDRDHIVHRILDVTKASDVWEDVAYLNCFAYLLLIEGIFDDLVRILYAICRRSQCNRSITLDEIEVVRIDDVNNDLKAKGIHLEFLRNWRTKNHIRNAIAHARFLYNDQEVSYHFEDYKIGGKGKFVKYDCWKKDMPVTQFRALVIEMDIPLRASFFTFILLRSLDLIRAQKMDWP